MSETASSPATVSVRLKGETDDSQVDLDHHTRFYINGTLFEDVYWAGRAFVTVDFRVPSESLIPGRNRITIEEPGDTDAGPVDRIFINSIDVEYPKRYGGRKGEAWFGPPTGFNGEPVQYEIENMGTRDALILDMGTGRVFTDYSHELQENGWTLSFCDPAPSTASLYWASLESALKAPASIELDAPSFLRDRANQADLVIIADQQFIGPLQQLVEFRRAQGVSVIVADVEDVFDEFSYGAFNPFALRAFVAYTYFFWTKPAPTHVLLVGDASWDYRFALDDSTIPNYVPSYLDPARDDKFVNVTGRLYDWYPDLAIGRMPVQNAQELTSMVVGSIAYETNPPQGDWTRRALFVTGGDIEAQQRVFQDQSHWLQELLPNDFHSAEVFRGAEEDDIDEFYSGRILEELNEGALLTVFLGHGAPNQWGNVMLQDQALWGLDCNGKMSIVCSMTCHTGRYANPKTPCLGERFVLEGDALDRAAAYWGSTGLSSIGNDYWLVYYLMESIFQDGITDMGLAIMTAKLKFYEESQDVTLASSQTWLGDPMLKINVTPMPAPQDVTVAMRPDGASVTWAYPDGAASPAAFNIVCHELPSQGIPRGSALDDGLSFWAFGDAREFMLTGLDACARYCVAVKAVVSSGAESRFSEKACFIFGQAGSEGPTILAAGYFDTFITSEEGGALEMFALVRDPDGADDIDEVELYYGGNPTGVLLSEVAPELFFLSQKIEPGLFSGIYLLSLSARDKEGNTSAHSPFFSVRGFGLQWPGEFDTAGASSFDFDHSDMDGPKVLAAGYLPEGITSFAGGDTSLLAIASPGLSGAAVSRVDVFVDGQFVGASLLDDGDSGDFMPNDGILGLEAPFGPGQVPGNYLIGLRAVDELGNKGPMWPFIYVW